MTRDHWWNWKFLVALTLLLLVVYLVWVGWTATRERDSATERLDRVVALVEAGQARDRRDQAEADRTRDLLALSQKRLIRQYDVLDRRYRALLAWLRSQDITPPARVLRPHHSTSTHQTTQPADPPPTAGHSGKTPPGKAHGLHHPPLRS